MPTATSIITRRSQSSLMMGAGSVMAGTACAALRGNTEYLPATLCLIFVIFAQLSANFYYQYYDETNRCGNNIDNRIHNNSSRQAFPLLKECSIGMFFLAVMTGMSLIAMSGWWVMAMGVFVILFGWLACGGSTPLLRTPYGIICSFVIFGPVGVISTSFIQSMHESTEPLNWHDITPSLYMSIVIGLMCVNSTLLYGYSTYLTDLRNSKESFVTVCGKKATRILFLFNGFAYTGVTVFMCMSLHLNLDGLDMIPSALCLLVDIYIWWKMRTLPRYQLPTLIDVGNFNVLLMGLLSFLIFELTGTPDDSQLTFFGF